MISVSEINSLFSILIPETKSPDVIPVAQKIESIKDHKAMVASLKRGDEVITSGGIVGKIERVLDDDKVELKISENVVIEVIRSTIQSITNQQQVKK